MKKFAYALLCVLSLAVVFTSCKKSSTNEPTEPEPEPVGPVVVMDFEISYSNLAYDSVVVSVDPSVDTLAYYFDLRVAASYDEATIAAKMKENFDATIEYYSAFGYQMTYADFVSYGEDSYNFTGLSPETEYVIFAYEIDPETAELIGEIATATFTTPAIQIVGQKEITFAQATMHDEVATYRFWQVMAEQNASETELQYLTLSPSECASVVGSYTIADMDPNYTMFGTGIIDQAADDTTWTAVTFKAGSLEVTEADGIYTIEADLIGDDAYEYLLHVTATEAVEEESAAPARKMSIKKPAIKKLKQF